MGMVSHTVPTPLPYTVHVHNLLFSTKYISSVESNEVWSVVVRYSCIPIRLALCQLLHPSRVMFQPTLAASPTAFSISSSIQESLAVAGGQSLGLAHT